MTTNDDPTGRWPIARCDAAECQAPIIWAVTERAKRMPVDAEPTSRGNVVLHNTGGPAPVAVVLKPDRVFGRTDLHTSHFATCPAAAGFRRRRQP